MHDHQEPSRESVSTGPNRFATCLARWRAARSARIGQLANTAAEVRCGSADAENVCVDVVRTKRKRTGSFQPLTTTLASSGRSQYCPGLTHRSVRVRSVVIQTSPSTGWRHCGSVTSHSATSASLNATVRISTIASLSMVVVRSVSGGCLIGWTGVIGSPNRTPSAETARTV